MNIEFNGKKYKAHQDQKTAQLFINVNKKKVFAGFGEGNMMKGFKIVHDNAPQKAAEGDEATV